MKPSPSPSIQRRIAGAVVIATSLLPLAGAWIAGREWRTWFRFPPLLDVPAGYPQWSWIAGALVVLPLTAIVLSFVLRARRRATVAPSTPGCNDLRQRNGFPFWGWLAVAWTLAWWLLAWSRFSWFSRWQQFTFFPLWLGFIVAVNALVLQRGRAPLMRCAPRRWLLLFGVSALFWWLFEWLNRCVHNWHYLGVEDFGATAYALHASVCFSTVLPAVLAVREWLGTFDGFERATIRGPAWAWLGHRGTGAALLLGALAALLFTGLRPQEFYAALWIAPLVLAFGLGILAGRSGIWSELAAGDWRNAGAWALGALVCGGFWEMWNWHSAAKWIYTVPYVDRWQIFEMPLLGYAGYLGFGLECALVATWVAAAQAEGTAPGRWRGTTSESLGGRIE